MLAPGVFDLSAPITAYGPLTHRALAEKNQMQSFGFDEAVKNIFVVQTRRGHRDDGGLLVNRFDYKGRRLDTMTLDDFGHGTSIGVTRTGSTSFVWVESVAKADAGGSSNGTHVSRVPYRAGGSVTPSSKGVVDVTPPQTVGKTPVPQIDRVTGNLIVRDVSAKGRWSFYSVPTADALAHRWGGVRLLGSTPSSGGPDPFDKTKNVFPQGYAVAGTTAYLYYGTPDRDNAYIRKVALDPARVTNGPKTAVKVLPGMPSREPEGITVQVGAGGGPRLAIGLGEKRSNGVAYFNMAYAGRFVPTPPPPAPAPAPPPVAPSVLRVKAVHVSRARFLRTHRIPVRVAGVEAVGRIRILARPRGGRLRTVYLAGRRIHTTARTIGLKLSKRQFRRLRAARGRTRLAIAVRAAGQKKTVRATLRGPARR